MTNASLSRSYLKKATARFELLSILQKKRAYSDVVREAQEIVELALKGMLRQAGVEPPKWHDVGGLLEDHRERYPESVAKRIPRLAKASEWLRGEREMSFYGDVDFIPTEEYTAKEGRRAIAEAGFALETAGMVIKSGRG